MTDHISLIKTAVESHDALELSDDRCSGKTVFRCYIAGHVGADKHFLRVNENPFGGPPNQCCLFLSSEKKFTERFGEGRGISIAELVRRHFQPCCHKATVDGLRLKTLSGLAEAIKRFGDDIAVLIAD